MATITEVKTKMLNPQRIFSWSIDDFEKLTPDKIPSILPISYQSYQNRDQLAFVLSSPKTTFSDAAEKKYQICGKLVFVEENQFKPILEIHIKPFPGEIKCFLQCNNFESHELERKKINLPDQESSPSRKRARYSMEREIVPRNRGRKNGSRYRHNSPTPEPSSWTDIDSNSYKNMTNEDVEFCKSSYGYTYELKELEGVNITKMLICVEATTFQSKTFQTFSFQHSRQSCAFGELKQMWEKDDSMKFAIQCKNQCIMAIKPILAARSDVFKTMFETDMKEARENRCEITDCEPEVIQKMIEFCETDSIKNFKGFENDLFKIGHKYQIQQLMKFALEKMADGMTPVYLFLALQIADLYDLKEFKEWCMQYAYRMNIQI